MIIQVFASDWKTRCQDCYGLRLTAITYRLQAVGLKVVFIFYFVLFYVFQVNNR